MSEKPALVPVQILPVAGAEPSVASNPRPPIIEHVVPPTQPFDVSELAPSPAWLPFAWQTMARVGSGSSRYSTRFKVAYSAAGLSLLFDCEDERLSTSMVSFGDHVWKADCVEIFLQPDPAVPLYLQYDISPLGAEIVLLVPNADGCRHIGWLPWYYEESRRIRSAVFVRGGERAPGASVQGWSVEIFVPFALLVGTTRTEPTRGTRWRANFYRVDVDDDGARSMWAWCPRTGTSTHRYADYGALTFG
jgi:hypothetical protein